MRASPTKMTALLVGAVFAAAGCTGVSDLAPEGEDAIATELARAEPLATRPGLFAVANEVLASRSQTIHNNGIIWAGFNALTAQEGQLDAFDSGDGFMFGVAFGNEGVKSFFELSYEESNGHYVYGLLGTNYDMVSDAIHRRLYLGVRRYLRAVTGKSGRVVPFLVGGVAYHTFDVYGPGQDLTASVPIPESRLTDASGMGVYAGTGIEIYLSAQLSLGCDMRGSYWNWEGTPEATGENGTIGSSVSLYYHF